ncbi:hypothetical protein J7T55_005662 [Diaporthe amygdali]|uniref:uncharacterized protein n=1 Tax=Phomopsis amygdali TaxID=1214568 RepID=UPI0022FEC425|nr:uncharacterized protein J7T55_005662 [Diaporthe amygdali]KAJ0124324.1 hypothetical protein J7T55_005662 [Diaporthe amygdali]
MPPRSAAIDWEVLKPRVLKLLSEGKSQSQSQLEYQLRLWGRRTNLTEAAWRFADYTMKKRAENKKDSSLFLNGTSIPRAKVIKETRRYNVPTLLAAPAGNPKCPEGFDLVICTPPASPEPTCDLIRASTQAHSSLRYPMQALLSLPWLRFRQKLLRDFSLTSADSNVDVLDVTQAGYPTQSQSEVALGALRNAPVYRGGTVPLYRAKFEQELYSRYVTMPEWPEDVWTAEMQAVTKEALYDAQLFSILVFQISNNLMYNAIHGKSKLRSDTRLLGHELKSIVSFRSIWESLLKAGEEVTLRALIEKLFSFSIIRNDADLAVLLLQSGADPNQRIVCEDNPEGLSALDYALRWQRDGLINLLLDSGAVFGQESLRLAIINGHIHTADRMLQSDPSLDLDFNHLGDPNKSNRRYPEVDSISVLGTVCIHPSLWDNCRCRKTATMNHDDNCPMSKSIGILKYLIRKGVTITLETMILASSCVDLITLDLLLQHGGNVSGLNRFGSSCLAAAFLRDKLDVDIVKLLISRGATINIPPIHASYGIQESPLHSLCSRPPGMDEKQVRSIIALLVDAGADLEYRVQRYAFSSEHILESVGCLGDGFLEYCVPHAPESVHSTRARIAETSAESPLEYSIIAKNEEVALELLNRGVEITGQETALAAEFGMLLLLKELLRHARWESNMERLRTTCLKLAIKYGHDGIVQFLFGEGVELEEDIACAFQGRGASKLSTQTQIKLLHALPDLERLQVSGQSLLQCCLRDFTEDALRYTLSRMSAAYDSGALCAAILRVLQHDAMGRAFLGTPEIKALASRRTVINCDCEKENTTLLITAAFGHSVVLRMLITPGTPRQVNTAWLAREVLITCLESGGVIIPYRWPTYTEVFPAEVDMHPGCEDWVKCSPLVGVAMAADEQRAGDIMDCLLACSYEPDALTVIVAVAAHRMAFLHRLQQLSAWRSLVSIDDHSRPAWCPTALQMAAHNGDWDVAMMLLEAGANVNEEPPKHTDRLKLLPRTALQASVDRGDLNLVNLFLEHGASIDAPAAKSNGATALQLACMRGYLGIIHRLLDLGADPDARGAQYHGHTALEAAAEYGRVDTLQLLLNYGASTDGPHITQYMKAVLRAKRNGHYAAAALLKEHREWSAEDDECYRSLESYEWRDD